MISPPFHEASCVNLIGVGLLGTAMASRWLAQGWQVRGYDCDSARRDALTQLGGQSATDIADLARDSGPIVFCLPDASSVQQAFSSIESHLSPGRILIDTTTVAPEDAIMMAQRCQRHRTHWIEANVAGSSQQMKRGEAILLLAGEEATIAAVRPVFSALTEQDYFVGPSGNAARMKLVVNLAIGLHRAVLAEALSLARAYELDLPKTLEILRACPSYSTAMDIKGAKMLMRDFAPEARLAQHLKDVRLMLAAGQEHGQPLPLSELHASLLQSLVAREMGHLDNSAILLAWDISRNQPDSL